MFYKKRKVDFPKDFESIKNGGGQNVRQSYANKFLDKIYCLF